MNNYKLYIGGKVVDTQDGGISILFQRQRTDYTNPTIVKNSFTKTIKLPGTKTNNSIFNEIWKLDRVQWTGAFNASKRTEFILIKDGALVEKGYAKLNNIVWDGHFYSYEVTLYGELGNLLYGLSYSVDDVTEDTVPLTLGDLDLGFSSFEITKDLVRNAWRRLSGDTSALAIFDTLNFMVSYDGVPQAKNFDPKKMWCSVDRLASVEWKENFYYAESFPSSITEDDVTYTTVDTFISRMDPNDHYGLLELKNDMTPLETRDLRSYLLRPILRIKKVFEAIGSYINTHYGYTLDISDPFFSSSEFTSTWLTLSMLYEIDPEVESGTRFTKKQLLQNTSSPASYLISYCKTYGIYMDVDFINKTLTLTRLPNFFTGQVNELLLDKSKQIKITPLSFDKASYTFDYGDGDGEFLKRYKDTYGIQYGSKRVNTGYRFDASSAPYIDNNVYKQGLDSLDQSVYFKYPYAVRSGHLFTYPTPLMDDANRPSYKLFDMNTYHQTGEVKTIDGEMSVGTWYPHYNNTAYGSIVSSGYQWMDVWWAGLREGVWQDGFPKLQFHSEGNSSADGKDVLVRYDDFHQVSYGHISKSTDRTYWNPETYNSGGFDATKVNYLLSDDFYLMKDIIGTNAYYDCPQPVDGYGVSYITVINSLPSFVRCDYSYTRNSSNIPGFYVAAYDTSNLAGTSDVALLKYNANFLTNVAQGSGRQYPYFTNYSIDRNHRYFLASVVKTLNSGDATVIATGNDYACPDIVGSTIIDSTSLRYGTDNTLQLIGSIVQTGNSTLNQVTPLSTYNASRAVSWNTFYLVIYDLTELGLESTLTTVEDCMLYFNVTSRTVGFPYNINNTLDFGVSREIYVPATTYAKNIGVYNKYWAHYIADVYSVDTKVFEAYCYLDNIDEVFREFYHYDNSLWILSKIVDWNIDTKYCKATFIKVNDKDNYLS